ncbi:MAG TPA: hypothetical protein VEA99_19030 [Gemmatimonadaceae bacterium]|nr:hypothetical protein [Gemmatimonadaceae bacterium]
MLRDLDAARHADLFLVSAVSTILAIRGYLFATGYPQVGGATLHVAHMLWGGLLMVAALVMLLAFLGRRPRHLAAFVGGVGFGTFIDEVGKFVTRDHDYFYRPAVALMYGTLALVYLAWRILHRRHPSPEELLANALQEVEQAVVRDLDQDERDRALHWIARAGPGHPIAHVLEPFLRAAPLVSARSPGPISRFRRVLAMRYRRLATHPRFARAIVVFFVAQLALKLAQVIVLAARDADGIGPLPIGLWSLGVDRYTTAEWLQLGSSLLSALLVVRGVVAMRTSRAEAFRWFQRSILASIFLTQVFMFFREQWAALAMLAFNLVVLGGVNFVREQERRPEGGAASS